jgi:hypothetical protein
MATSPQPLTDAHERSPYSCPRCRQHQRLLLQQVTDCGQPLLILSPRRPLPHWFQQLRRLLSPEQEEARA